MKKIVDLGRLSQILLAPLVSEKSTHSASKENSVVFWVKTDASKPEIFSAVEHFFPELLGKVESVTTSIIRGKSVKRGSTIGKKNKRKKAYIKLSQGADLKFEGLE